MSTVAILFRTSSSSMAASSMAPAGRASTHPKQGRLRCQHRPEPDPLARGRRRRHQARFIERSGRPGRPGRPFLRRCRRQRGRHRPEGRGAGLYRGLRAGHGRIGPDADRQPASRRAGAADPAAAGRLPVPRPGEVRRLVRRRRRAREGRLHGRLAGAVGHRALAGEVTEPAWKRSRAGIWSPPTTT